jgi:hypothetical protein
LCSGIQKVCPICLSLKTSLIGIGIRRMASRKIKHGGAGGEITTHWNGPAGRNGPCDSQHGRAPGRPFNADPLYRPRERPLKFFTRDWPNPVAELANGTQVLNVEGRVVVLQRRFGGSAGGT